MSRSHRPTGRHLVLVGPTASGKSGLAMALAGRRRAAGEQVEIVSMDSMAVYRGMDIGTTTPSSADRAQVPHHLIDVVDPEHDFSVAEFVLAVDAALDDIESRDARAILAGGTGLYVRAVVDALDLPGRYPEARLRIESEPDTATLYERLGRLDPVAAGRVEPDNRRRIVRALEVTEGSGRMFSDHGPGLEDYPPTPFVLAGLAVDREVLGRRIAPRVDQQLRDGFVEEVRALAERPDGVSRTARQALGYSELAQHLRGECTLDEAVERIVVRTRQFAVRQIRWFRRDPRIAWFDHDAGNDPSASSDAAAPVDRVDRLWRSRARSSGPG